mmetsp:Transcript_29099/g.42484  ORF Transcript_29099/g.42484 Transcript_29099/m.42484 type:complete len:333 (+) Transcript_29099:119-1117(+)
MKEQTTKNTKHSNSFTQHCIGILILLFTISTLNLSLSQNNHHNLSQNNDNTSSNTLLSTIVFICSFINTASHISVVAGTLQEVLVLSILIGVSFDVVSQLLYVTFLMTTHSIVTNNDDTFMIRYSSNNNALHVLHLLFGMMIIPSFFVLQIMLHIRALRLHVSYSRMNQVVQSAQNNIMQKPGRCYVDHLFAYSDLGHHVFYFMLSSRFLGWVRVVRILFGLVVVVVIVMGIVVVAWKWYHSDINTTTIHPPNMTQNNNKNEKPPLLVMQDGKPVCSCNVCQNKRNNDHQQSAFLVDVKNGVLCKLWFMTFGQLCTLMECTEEEEDDERKKL